MDLIDRIRSDIQERLDTILSEADKLSKALAALGPRQGSSISTPSRARTASSRPSPRSRTSQPTPPAQSRGIPPGSSKQQILEALADGGAKTAGEVASETGVARGTVSTTLSKLVKAGEVIKAERGYRLPSADAPAAPNTTGPETDAPSERALSEPVTDAPSEPALSEPVTDAPSESAPSAQLTDAPSEGGPSEPSENPGSA